MEGLITVESGVLYVSVELVLESNNLIIQSIELFLLFIESFRQNKLIHSFQSPDSFVKIEGVLDSGFNFVEFFLYYRGMYHKVIANVVLQLFQFAIIFSN